MQGLFWLEVWNGVGDELSLKLRGGTCGKRWGLSLRIGAGPWAEGGKEGLRIGKSGWRDRMWEERVR